MKFIHPIYLIYEEEITDKAGDTTTVQEKVKVFADKVSISQNEFYQSHSAGLKPEIKFKMRTCEYKYANKLEYDNQVFNIVRTFAKDETVELICSREELNGT